jgi:hypothetical protein
MPDREHAFLRAVGARPPARPGFRRQSRRRRDRAGLHPPRPRSRPVIGRSVRAALVVSAEQVLVTYFLASEYVFARGVRTTEFISDGALRRACVSMHVHERSPGRHTLSLATATTGRRSTMDNMLNVSPGLPANGRRDFRSTRRLRYEAQQAAVRYPLIGCRFAGELLLKRWGRPARITKRSRPDNSLRVLCPLRLGRHPCGCSAIPRAQDGAALIRGCSIEPDLGGRACTRRTIRR